MTSFALIPPSWVFPLAVHVSGDRQGQQREAAGEEEEEAGGGGGGEEDKKEEKGVLPQRVDHPH